MRVVGENSFGGVWAAALWGGTIELITHRPGSNHLKCNHLNLSRSISQVDACSMDPLDPPWNGIFLATIQGAEDAEDIRVLFENWQPLIKVPALPSSLTQKELTELLRVMHFSDTHARLRVIVKHIILGGGDLVDVDLCSLVTTPRGTEEGSHNDGSTILPSVAELPGRHPGSAVRQKSGI